MRNVPICSDEMFVIAWEKASTVEEAARLCGYSNPGAATNRATRLRRRGVRLRSFKDRHPSAAKLNWMAKRAAEESAP